MTAIFASFCPIHSGPRISLRRLWDWAANWIGARPDSKPPIEAAEELIAWWKQNGHDPIANLIVLSDALTIDSIEASVRHLRRRAQVAIDGDLSNNFSGCVPHGAGGDLAPPSLVCKVIEVKDVRP